MTAETRESVESARFAAWIHWCETTNQNLEDNVSSFAAGFAAGHAHAKPPADPFVCDICGQPAIIGLRKNPGARLRRWCVEHFPEVERDA